MKLNCDNEGIEKASSLINDGGIIVFPTDTVYGIGCDPFNKKSIERLYQLKNRPRSKPFPVLVDSMKTASDIVELDDISKKLVEKFWPGPLTLVLNCNNSQLMESLNVQKVGVRVPKNDCLLDLLHKVKFLIGTSANLSGENSFTDPQEWITQLKGYDAFLDGGKIGNLGESTILEIRDGKPIFHRIGALKEVEFEGFF